MFVDKVKRYLAEIEKEGQQTETPVAPVPDKKHYRVQVGYYSVKKNAEAMRDKLKAAGFPAIIKEE